jgi:hypothetical protein
LVYSLVLYLVFAGVAILLPGIALQRLVRVPVEASLVVPLGTAFCGLAFWLSLAAHAPALFPVAVASLVAAAWLARRGPLERAAGPSIRRAIPPAIGLVLLLAIAQYPWNRVEAETGDFLLDPLVTSDSAFHVGVTHELLTGEPPQVPGVAGFPLGYHLGTDLVRAAALRWAGVDPWDSLTRLDVTLWGFGLILALRSLTARLGAPPLAVALVPWTLLLTDFSFVFASNPQAHWWCDLLRGNLLLSLVYSNPVLPALGLALAALVSLAGFEETRRPGHLAFAALLAAAVPFFKVFLGAQLLLALGAAFLLARGASRTALVVTALPAAVATAALVLGQGAETVAVAFAPLDLVHVTRETLGLEPVAGLRLAAAAALWVALSLGLRLVGLAEAWRALRGSTLASAAAALALSGWPLGLLFRVAAPEVLSTQKVVNDAAYLVEQSGPLLWVFAAMALARLAHTRRRQALVAAGVLLLATPSTWQYVAKKSRTAPDRLPAPMVRAMDALANASLPGDVVLQRPGGRYPPAPVVLAGRRVTYERFTPYLTQFASKQDLEARHAAVYRFFRTESRDEALSIAGELGASFLALYANDRVRFDTTGVLEPVHEETGARVYRIVGLNPRQ